MAGFETTATESVPLSRLPDDVVAAMEAAKERLARATVPGGPSRDARLAAARAAAKTATEASNQAPSAEDLVERLSAANADMCAVASSAQLDEFPREVSVEALLSVANLAVSVGRRHQLDGDLESALDHFVAGLRVVRAFRAYSRVASVDQAVYGIAARAGAAVGAIAARRRLNLATMLDALDRNVVGQYENLMTNGDLSGPRAFAVVALLREALRTAAGVNDLEYLRGLRGDIVARREELAPRAENARQRFDSDLAALLAEAAARLGEETNSGFNW